MLQFRCFNCDSDIKVPKSLAGQVTLCPECKERIKVPSQPSVDLIDDEAFAESPVSSPRRARPEPVEHADLRRGVSTGDGFRFGIGFLLAIIAIPIGIMVVAAAFAAITGLFVATR